MGNCTEKKDITEKTGEIHLASVSYQCGFLVLITVLWLCLMSSLKEEMLGKSLYYFRHISSYIFF